MTATASTPTTYDIAAIAAATPIPSAEPEMQQAFTKKSSARTHSTYHKYFSINQLMNVITSRHPDINTLAVLFDRMYDTKYKRVNITPLAVIVIKPDKSTVKIEYADLMNITEGITDISVPSMVFNRLQRGEFQRVVLRRLDIDGSTSVMASKDGTTHNYHKSRLIPVTTSLQVKLEEYQNARAEALDNFEPTDDESVVNLDDII